MQWCMAFLEKIMQAFILKGASLTMLGSTAIIASHNMTAAAFYLGGSLLWRKLHQIIHA